MSKRGAVGGKEGEEGNGTSTLSEYEKIRLENIARNDAFLDSLGLSNRSMKTARPPSQGKRRKIFVEGQRQSLRLAQLPAAKYDEQILDAIDRDAGEGDDDSLPRQRAQKKSTSATITRGPPSADSSRALKARLDRFIEGDLLGVKVGEYGKAAVMAEANGGKVPRFNKYSGFVEWSDCIFLWVNLGEDGGESSYSNIFSEGGRHITWFGGSRVYEDSEITKRLLAYGNPQKDPKHPESIVLFVRLRGESYCCLGRLEHREYNLTKHPIAFTWVLRDFDTLKEKRDFLDILKKSKI